MGCACEARATRATMLLLQLHIRLHAGNQSQLDSSGRKECLPLEASYDWLWYAPLGQGHINAYDCVRPRSGARARFSHWSP